MSLDCFSLSFSVPHSTHLPISTPFKKSSVNPQSQDGIRHGYWALYDAARAERTVGDAEEAAFMGSPLHMRHCIDLLRQTLMCRPDLTVEVKDEAKGGVTGFGTEHRCEDWGQLVRWTAEWETWMQDRAKKGVPPQKHNSHEHK